MDVEEESDLRKFCQLLLNCPDSTEIMWKGSTFELPMMFSFSNKTDLDILRICKQFLVLPYNYDLAESEVNHERLSNKRYWVTATEFWPRETVLRIDSKKCHIGFTQLVYDDDMTKIALIKDIRKSENNAVCTTLTWLSKSEQIWKMLENFAKSGINFEGLPIDLVDGLRCPVWPEEANEWKTRKRNHCWPSQENINSIVASGCYLVAKSHDNQLENISEWRFSFLSAELTLIHSWNYEQKCIYHLLRLIKSDVIRKCEEKKQKSLLKNYHFKTLMLWTCENQPPEFWNKENLESSLEILLCTLIEWMNEKTCSNYFIPKNNMWDNIPSDCDFDLEAQNILSSIQDIKYYMKKIVHLQDENVENESERNLAVPKKLLTAIQLRCYRQCHVYQTSHGRERFLPPNALEDSEYFTSKMESLFRALNVHGNIVSKNFGNQNEQGMIEEALSYFERFRETKFDGYINVKYSFFERCQDVFGKIIDSNIDSNYDIPNPKSESLPLEALLNSLFQVVSDDIGNPFYFLCCAYEANFHFTAFEDKCDEIKRDHWMKALELCKKGLSEEASAKEKFPFWICPSYMLLMVTVTKELVSIFDEYIKSVLSISSPLCDDIEKSEFSVHFSSIDFLRYVRIQCMRKLKDDFNEDEEILKMENASDCYPTTKLLRHALQIYD